MNNPFDEAARLLADVGRRCDARGWVLGTSGNFSARLGGVVRELLAGWPDCHAFLLRRHGLYTWGATLQDAIRHVEIVEFLLESVARAEYSGQPKSEEVAPWRS